MSISVISRFKGYFDNFSVILYVNKAILVILKALWYFFHFIDFRTIFEHL